jgi:thioredoxin 1
MTDSEETYLNTTISSPPPPMKEIITELNKESFTENLRNNPGIFIIKFGAEWCGPCKAIESLVEERMNKLSNRAKCAIIDIDDNFEIYAALKSKRVVNGIPVILGYKKGNMTHVPNEVIIGADKVQINTFFNRCESHIA